MESVLALAAGPATAWAAGQHNISAILMVNSLMWLASSYCNNAYQCAVSTVSVLAAVVSYRAYGVTLGWEFGLIIFGYFCIQWLQGWISLKIARNELILLLQGVLSALHGFFFILGDSSVRNIGDERDCVVFICTVLLGGTALLVTVGSPLVKARHSDRATRAMGTGLLASAIGIVVGCVEYPLLWRALGTEPFAWVLTFVMSDKTRLLCFFYLFAVTCLAVLCHPSSKLMHDWTHRIQTIVWPGISLRRWNLILRKFFHIMAVILVAPALLASKETALLLFLALAVASKCMVLLELARSLQIYPDTIFVPLQKYMGTYVDERDCGPLVLTHLYLIFGISLPIWLDMGAFPPTLSAFGGILSLGLGDAAAAMVGLAFTVRGIDVTWGRVCKKLGIACPASVARRTVQGTVGASLTMFIASLCFGGRGLSITFLLSSSAMVALLETFSPSIDNAILPITMWLLLRLGS